MIEPVQPDMGTLQGEILLLSRTVRRQIERAARAFVERDRSIAEEVIERDDLSEAVRDGFSAVLRDLPVACGNLERESPPATPADGEMPARSRTRSSASRRGP